MRDRGALAPAVIHTAYRHHLDRRRRALVVQVEFPLESKITLEPLLGMLEHDRHEQGAVADLMADRLIPRVPAPQLALIEKDLDAGGAQRLANLLGRLRVL
jgi:hypothetical protein